MFAARVGMLSAHSGHANTGEIHAVVEVIGRQSERIIEKPIGTVDRDFAMMLTADFEATDAHAGECLRGPLVRHIGEPAVTSATAIFDILHAPIKAVLGNLPRLELFRSAQEMHYTEGERPAFVGWCQRLQIPSG